MNCLQILSLCLIAAGSLSASAGEGQVSDIGSSSLHAKHSSDHRGPRGHRGKRGFSSHSGAYIETIEVLPTVSTVAFPLLPNAILPLGNSPADLTPLHLQYIDPTPSSATTDRYIEVLEGGKGKYLIEWSITAIGTGPNIGALTTQLEVSHNKATYDDVRSVDALLPIQISEPSGTVYLTTGTRSTFAFLKEGDRVHIRVLAAPTTGIALMTDTNARCVNVTMKRLV